MDSIGSYLKNQRKLHSLSLNDVCERTGITTTRLNRIERNLINEPSPGVLKKLSALYKVDIIFLYKLAGYLEVKDLKEQVQPFRNSENLNAAEREFIQHSIDFLIKKNFTDNREEYHEI